MGSLNLQITEKPDLTHELCTKHKPQDPHALGQTG